MDWIVLKALCTDPAGRCPSAEHLSADLGRRLYGSPARTLRERPADMLGGLAGQRGRISGRAHRAARPVERAGP